MSLSPLIGSLPLTHGVVAGPFEWPALGSMLAWTLIAALVGVLLALLRERQAALSRTGDAHAGCGETPADDADSYREAA